MPARILGRTVRFLVLSLVTLSSVTGVRAQCLEIESILVDACSSGGCSGAAAPACNCEGKNEMVRFEVGGTDLALTDITPTWPNNSFQGWCRDATSAAMTDSLNATIATSCGWLLEPLNDTLPAGSTVLAITSTDVCITANSFDGLADTIFVIYQCAGNWQGHFANGTGTGTRTTIFTVTGPCTQTESVTYDRAPLPGSDGGTAFFDPAGNATYDNIGCNAPVPTLSPAWALGEVCLDAGIVNLNDQLLAGSATGGTWSGPGVTDSLFDPVAAGIGPATITYSVGTGSCSADSTVTVLVDTASIGLRSLNGCDSVLFFGQWYASDTVLLDTISGATPLACDSITRTAIVISDLISHPDTLRFTSCDSVLYDGMWHTASTVLFDTLAGPAPGSASTCTDLFISEVLEGASNDKAVEIYNGTSSPIDLTGYTLQFFFNGNTVPFTTIALSGTVVPGDVFVVADDGANATITSVADLISSQSFFNGNDAIGLFDPGGNLVDLVGNIGCDPGSEWTGVAGGTQNNSIIRLPGSTTGVTVDPPNPPCDFPTFTPANWTSTNSTSVFDSLGTHTANCDIVTTSACDSLQRIEITVLQPVTGAQDLVGCDSVLADGSWVTASTILRDTLPNAAANGCDSITVFAVTVLNAVQTTTVLTACDSATINGTTYTATQIVRDTFVAATGCDSVHVTDLTVSTFVQVTRFVTGCDSAVANGQTLFASTVVRDTVVGGSATGCDSITVFDVTVNNSVTTAPIALTGCDSAVYGGATFFADAGFNDTLAAGSGCDSIVPVAVTVLSSPVGVVDTSACDQLTVGAQTFTSDTVLFIPSGPAANGCDSTTQVNVTIRRSIVADTVVAAGCDSVVLNGTTYFASTTFNDTLVAANGCDSIVPSVVTVSVATTSLRDTSACDSLVVGGLTLTGDTTVVLPDGLNAAGCDSTTTWTVTIVPTIVADTVVATGCDSAVLGGTTFFASTSFNDTLATVTGCDSIVPSVVTVLAAPVGVVDTSACDQLTVGAQTFTRDTVLFVPSGPAANGCDSTTQVNVTIRSSVVADTVVAASCDSVVLNGTTYFASTTFNDTLVAANGCDSIVPSVVTVSVATTSLRDTSACDSLVVGGVVLSADTVLTLPSGLNAAGCDSATTWTVSIFHSVVADTVVATGCDSVVIGGVVGSLTLRSDTVFDQVLATVTGCDSIVPTQVTVRTAPQGVVDTSACEQIVIGGTLVTASDTIVLPSGVGANGCDSTTRFQVTIFRNAVTDVVLDGCDSVRDRGTWYTATTAFADTITGATPDGCDSIRNVAITVRSSSTASETVTACDTAVVLGTTYTSSTVVDTVLTNAAGCDSTLTVTVTILNSSGSVRDTLVCFTAFPVTLPDGRTADGPGSFSSTLVNTAGCDSVVTTVVTENRPVVTAFGDTVLTAPGTVPLVANGVGSGPITIDWTDERSTFFCGDCPFVEVTPDGLNDRRIEYIATGTDTQGCAASDTVVVEIDAPCSDGENLRIPNAITPNGDGFNDAFFVGNDQFLQINTIRIFDRWGAVMWQAASPTDTWDGTFNGRTVEAGVYVWMVEVTCFDGTQSVLSGDVTVVR